MLFMLFSFFFFFLFYLLLFSFFSSFHYYCFTKFIRLFAMSTEPFMKSAQQLYSKTSMARTPLEP